MNGKRSAEINYADQRVSIASSDSTTDEDFVLPNMASLLDIVERPLFIEQRRPIEDQGDDTDPALTPVMRTKMTAKLMGVYSDGAEMVALIMDAKGNYRRRRQGDDVDGWQIEKLHDDRVTMIQGGANEELILRKPKPKVMKRPKPKPKSPIARKRGQTEKPRLPMDLKAQIPTATPR